MFSSAQGAGLFASAFCMSVVVPAAIEASANQYIVINVAYHPLKFKFVLQQLPASLWVHFKYHVPYVPFCFESKLGLDVPFLQFQVWVLSEDDVLRVFRCHRIRYILYN
jgi:hypothetical protein